MSESPVETERSWALRFAELVDRINDLAGRCVAWLTLATVALLFAQVPLRMLPTGLWSVTANDMGQLIHAAVFMTGIAYALRWDQHARVDVFYRAMSARSKAWVNLIGYLLFALPWLAVLGYYGLPVVRNSWKVHEIFPDSWAPGMFLLKTMLLVFVVLTGLQSLANLVRAALRLWPAGRGTPGGQA